MPSRDKSNTRPSLRRLRRNSLEPPSRNSRGLLAVASFARSTGSARWLLSRPSTDIRRTLGPRDMSTIRERSLSRRTLSRKSVALSMQLKAQECRVTERKKAAVRFFAYSARETNYWRTRVTWRTANTLATGRTRSGKSRGRRTDDVRSAWRVSLREVGARRRDRRDGVRDFPISVDDDPSTAT